MFLLVSLSKTKFFTFAFDNDTSRKIFVLNSCPSCSTRVALVSLLSHSCPTRCRICVTGVALVSLVFGTHAVN